MSRELGGALGVAVIGTIVNGLYSSNVADPLAGSASPQLVEAAREGIGGAVLASEGVAGGSVGSFLDTANRAFVDAITTGFRISAAILVATLVVAFALLPRRMRTAQDSRRRPAAIVWPRRAPRISGGRTLTSVRRRSRERWAACHYQSVRTG